MKLSRGHCHCCPVYIVITVGLLFVAAVISTAVVTKRVASTKSAASGAQNSKASAWFNYTNQGGFFLQDQKGVDGGSFNYVETNLGLINRTYSTDSFFDPKGERTQWERFAYYVRNLTATAPKGTTYKVLILGRHGEGWHNVEEANVGSPLWNCYWSRRDGDGNITWANADLTPLGIQQALTANAFWKRALVEAKVPAPESFYVSPLRRTLRTQNFTFNGVELPADRPWKPIVKENLREFTGVHTCDRRDTKDKIASDWPSFAFESGFSDADTIWDPDYRESGGHNILRLQNFLDDVFANDNGTFISGTSHAGSLGSLLYAVGHQSFTLATGTVIPVFLKAERHEGARPVGKIDPPTKDKVCNSPSSKVRRRG